MNKKIIRRFLYYVLILGLFTAMAAFAVLAVKDAYPFVKSDIEIWQLREEVKEKKHNKTWEGKINNGWIKLGKNERNKS